MKEYNQLDHNKHFTLTKEKCISLQTQILLYFQSKVKKKKTIISLV